MKISYTDYFIADFELQQDWYTSRQDERLGLRYLAAVDAGVEVLATNPRLGTRCRFADRPEPELSGLWYFVLDRPFHTHIIFYRAEREELVAARVMSGFRDLQRRLQQPPGAD